MRFLARRPASLPLAAPLTSPYVTNPGRLADVIAAIQVMGVYRYYKLDFVGWADRIAADKDQADYWRDVFIAHPEFFRLDSGRTKASLVWRRQNPKTYHVKLGRDLSAEQIAELPPDEYRRITRRPLTPGDVNALVSTAIELHTRSLEHHRERRRWVDVLIGFSTIVAGLVGAIVGGFLAGQ